VRKNPSDLTTRILIKEVVMSKTVQRFLFTFLAVLTIVGVLAAGAGVTRAFAGEEAVITGLWVTPLEIDFGPVGVGTTTPHAAVTITNYSALPLNNFAGGGLSSPFAAYSDCNVEGGIPSGGHCHYSFTFSPTSEGEFSAVSSSSTSLGNMKIKVHGTGVGAKVVYDAHSLDMGSVHIGGSATEQVVTLRNVGLANLANFAGGGLPAPFSVSSDCNIPGGIVPGGSCHYNFNFSPDAAQSYNDTSSSSTSGGPVTIDVKGSGRSIIFGFGQRVSPLSLDFGPVGVATTGSQLTAEVHNQSFSSNITGWAGGAVPSPFNGSQDCNISGGLPPGQSCHFYYTFSPTVAGEFTATSNVSDSFGTFSVELHGTGVAPSQNVSPLWLDFGKVVLNTTSQQIVTITNTGLSPITGWAGGAVPDPFSGSQDCNVQGGLLPGNSCHFNYTFTPTASGFFTAKSNVSTSAGSFTILLQGGEHPAEYALGANFTGTGSGTVTSSPTGINCNTDCTGNFIAGSPVVLSASAAEFSVFTGWSSGCTGTGNCSTVANADRTLIATFDMDTAHRARIGSSYYSTLNLAYGGASSVGNVTIAAAGTDFNESLSLGGEKDITLKGGYLGNFTSNSDGYTSMHGVLTVGSGSLTVERLIITSI
jgi:hypothetical protein